MPQIERALDIISGQSKGYTQKPYAQRPPSPIETDDIETSLGLETEPQADYGPAEFLADITHPETDAHQVLVEAMAGLPHHSRAKRIAIAGNSLLAAGAALALSQQGEKTCLIEIGYDHQQAQIAGLLNFDASVGITDVFRKDILLDNLIVTARINRPNPNCYVLPQGKHRTEWADQQNAFASLVNALSKKFHRLIISIPSLDKAAAQALAQANVGWILADAQSPLSNRGAELLQQQGCTIQMH